MTQHKPLHRIKWRDHHMTWPRNRHQDIHKTSPPWNGRRLVHSKEMIWASRWSVALRTFYRQILSVLYSSYPFGNFRPRLVRALLVTIVVHEPAMLFGLGSFRSDLWICNWAKRISFLVISRLLHLARSSSYSTQALGFKGPRRTTSDRDSFAGAGLLDFLPQSPLASSMSHYKVRSLSTSPADCFSAPWTKALKAAASEIQLNLVEVQHEEHRYEELLQTPDKGIVWLTLILCNQPLASCLWIGFPLQHHQKKPLVLACVKLKANDRQPQSPARSCRTWPSHWPSFLAGETCFVVDHPSAHLEWPDQPWWVALQEPPARTPFKQRLGNPNNLVTVATTAQPLSGESG